MVSGPRLADTFRSHETADLAIDMTLTLSMHDFSYWLLMVVFFFSSPVLLIIP